MDPQVPRNLQQLVTPSFTLCIKGICWKLAESSGQFWALATHLLAWTCNKPFSVPDANVSVLFGLIGVLALYWRHVGYVDLDSVTTSPDYIFQDPSPTKLWWRLASGLEERSQGICCPLCFRGCLRISLDILLFGSSPTGQLFDLAAAVPLWPSPWGHQPRSLSRREESLSHW